MNVFVLNKDPVQCAKEHIDKHVVKMCTEYAQLLSTCHRTVDGTYWKGTTQNGRAIARYYLEDSHMNLTLYKASHINHPCNIWLRESAENYQWLYRLWINLGKEYTYRYGKVHKSIQDLRKVLIQPPENLESNGLTNPPPAMKEYPQCIVEGNIVASYRNYYWEAKRGFSAWTRRRKPVWWTEFENREKNKTMGVLNNADGLILE